MAVTRKVLDVGNCSFDHNQISRLIGEDFQAEVVAAHTAHETLQRLGDGQFDLVLVNRKLVADDSDGVELIRKIKAHPDLAQTPVMLLSNYPQSQRQAEAAGAESGFGKAQLDHPETREKLRKFLG